MKYLILFFAVAIFSFTACSSEEKHTESDEMHEAEGGHDHGDHEHGDATEGEGRTIEASSVKNEATTAIIDGYLQIKNALVADSKSGAASGGKALLSAFDNFDMTKLSGSQHVEYMDILENAKSQAEHIVKSTIGHQREHFEVLSVDINDLITLLGTDKTLYENFCPMANDGKGAIWLSEFEEIKNPFMGSKMPTCGKVQRQIN